MLVGDDNAKLEAHFVATLVMSVPEPLQLRQSVPIAAWDLERCQWRELECYHEHVPAGLRLDPVSHSRA
jgi:hypothetical protein